MSLGCYSPRSVGESGLSLRGDDASALTRRVLSYQVVVNPKNPAANVHLRIHHQRRSSTKAPWKDALAFSQIRLKAGEEISLDLHADEVLLLQKHLLNLYEVAKGGISSLSETLRSCGATIGT
ncbi:MAG: hypothetical protein ACREUE_11100 [Panacagrimonas sp.]